MRLASPKILLSKPDSTGVYRPEDFCVKFVTGSATGMILQIEEINFGTGEYTLGQTWLAPTKVMNSVDFDSGFAFYLRNNLPELSAQELTIKLASVSATDVWMVLDGIEF